MIERISDGLARLLRGREWYHRTSIGDMRVDGKYVTVFKVWGEYVHGERPVDCPLEYEGLRVEFCRVTPKHECPFGSVKLRTRTVKEQDA